MQTRRDVLRAIAASAAALALGPVTPGPAALAAGAERRIVAPFLEGGLKAGIGLWTRHAAPDARIDLPARAHAIALHPDAGSCVAVARRPGRFGVAVDLARFEASVTFEATPGRHFFGHGSFLGDGDLFLTTENDVDAGRGLIGLRDARRGFAAIGEWPSGGIGPHDLAISADAALDPGRQWRHRHEPGLGSRQAERGGHRLLDRDHRLSPPAMKPTE